MSRFAVLPARTFEDCRLSLSHIRVLGVLCCHTDKNGWAFPSVSRMASAISVSRQRASKCLQELKNWGYLEIRERQRKEDGGQTSNLYRVIFDFGDPVAPPATSEIAPPATSEIASPATSEVAPPATSEVAPRTNPFELSQLTTTGGEVVDLDELVQASLWAMEQSRQRVGPGLASHVRSRVARQGLNEKDHATLAAWRAANQKKEAGFHFANQSARDKSFLEHARKKLETVRLKAGI